MVLLPFCLLFEMSDPKEKPCDMEKDVPGEGECSKNENQEQSSMSSMATNAQEISNTPLLTSTIEATPRSITISKDEPPESTTSPPIEKQTNTEGKGFSKLS